MISIIITSFKEPKTIGKAIESFLNQKIREKYEIIVCAPDKETLDVAKKYNNVRIFKDPGKGKPTALNLVIKKAKGDILILTDGDVYVSKNSVANLLKHFRDKSIGAVSGKPVSLNSKGNIFGYWAYILTEGMHFQRLKRVDVCSGYLYAIRKKAFENIPQNILADDAYISLSILKKGYKILYEPKSEVYIKSPSNLKDWIRQKKRTAGRFYQLKQFGLLKSKTHELVFELESGIKTLKLVRNFKQIVFFILLVIMRFYIWFRVMFDFRLWKRGFKKTWQRVESTK